MQPPGQVKWFALGPLLTRRLHPHRHQLCKRNTWVTPVKRGAREQRSRRGRPSSIVLPSIIVFYCVVKYHKPCWYCQKSCPIGRAPCDGTAVNGRNRLVDQGHQNARQTAVQISTDVDFLSEGDQSIETSVSLWTTSTSTESFLVPVGDIISYLACKSLWLVFWFSCMYDTSVILVLIVEA